MAQCKQSPQEFIRGAFTPQVAVICTPLAEKQCQKNNLCFTELLQPFCKLSNDVYFKDPTGAVVTVKNLKVSFVDVNSRPPQTTLARKYLNSSVGEFCEFRSEVYQTASGCNLDVTPSTPWFEAWRDTFLKVQYPADHEYTKHFLCCVLVVSSSEVNAIDSIIHLSQTLNPMQNNGHGKLPKWFNSNILKYYLILHDNYDGNLDVANESYESVKNAYGEANTFLLRMNSRPPGFDSTGEHLPDPWSQFITSNIDNRDLKITPEGSPYTSRANLDHDTVEVKEQDRNYHPLSPDTEDLILTPPIVEKEKVAPPTSTLHGLFLSTEDVDQIKLFLYEFCKSCLMPFVERQVQQLSDIISNKKGMSRSLFSATKRWFNPNKPGASSVAVNNLLYSPDAPELQVRRLADLYFIFGHYAAAFHAYHLAKRDYNTDQAWLYYAGALEMASLAAFMANEASRKTCDYMEESINTYLNTCKMPQFATRATLLGTECLKSRAMYGEAAHQFIRMTSEESDLRSALFLEQASFCFLHSNLIRKYAFHMVLAGHRFSKAAQRKHSLRCYKQAHQIYENSGWDLAEDQIHYTIGRQAHNLHSFDEAVRSFAKLLKGESKQSVHQQGVYLKEYLTILGNKLVKDGDGQVPTLAIPQLNSRSLQILMGPTPPLSTPGKVPAYGINFTDSDTGEVTAKWHKLEEMLVQEAQGSLPVVFRPMITLHTVQNLGLNKSNPIAIVNEPIQVSVQLLNCLQIVLHIKDLYLLWTYKDGDTVVSNHESYVKTHVTKSLQIQGNSSQSIVLVITPLVTGNVQLNGIGYTLTSSATPNDNIFIKGKQLFDFDNVRPGNLKEIDIKVVPLAPCLQVTFSELNSDFLCDEVQNVVINFQNTGTVPLHKISIGTSVPHLLCNCDNGGDLPPYLPDLPPAKKDKFIRNNHVTLLRPSSYNDRLEPSQGCTLSIYVRAPSTPGACLVDLLIYYESVDPKIQPRYRLVRHKWNLTVQESIKVEASVQGSFNSKLVEEAALVLKVQNLNKTHSSTLAQITILNVGFLSNQWTLSQNSVKSTKLDSQESAHIFLKAKRTAASAGMSSIVLQTSDLFTRSLQDAYLAFAKKTEQCQINVFEEDVSIEKDRPDGILLVQWQATIKDASNRRDVSGQSVIPIYVHKTEEDGEIDEFAAFSDVANFLEMSINREKSDHRSGSETKVTYNLIHPPVVSHDFSKRRLCAIPITLLIHSIVPNETLRVSVNTLGAASRNIPPHSGLFYPFASKHFSWLGIGSTVKEVKPLSTIPIQLSVGVSKPGTFDLGSRIEVYCTSETNNVLQNCEMQSALIVRDANS